MLARLLIAASCSSLAASLATAASASEPPPGWEAAPLPSRDRAPKKASGKPDLPACCAHDTTCCARQLAMDTTAPDRVARVVEVSLDGLPALVVKEGDELRDADPRPPGIVVFDGLGRPSPWPDGPREELRAVPVGRYGSMRWGSDWDWTPFWQEPKDRPLGWGLSRAFWRDHADTRSLLTGPMSYVTLDRGAGDAIAVDYVRGTLEGKPEIHVSRWAHVEAVPVADGFVYAFRGWPPRDGEPDVDEPGGSAREGDAVTFVLPGASLGFESKEATHGGGRRFRDAAHTTFTLPIGPSRSGLATGTVFEEDLARWFPRPRGAAPLKGGARIVLASSQTTAEAAPRVRLVYFAG